MRGGALFKGKEGRGDFRKEISHHCFLNPLLKLERCPQKSFSNLRESNIFFSPHHLKDSKNKQFSFTSSRIWELSFILFFLSLHRVTQI